MKVGILQFTPIFGQVPGNIFTVQKTISQIQADLVVLPELFNTGYQFVTKEEVGELAEPVPNGFTTQRLVEMAQKNGLFIVAGLAERDGDRVYNSAVLVGPRGFVGVYRKAHLFYEEKLWFDPGDGEFPVFDIGPAKIGLMICFDWIFPEVSRILALQGAQVICQPANLVLPYCQGAMVTRAIENRVFTVTANRVGNEHRQADEELRFTGMSQVVDPKGQVLFRLGETEEALRVVEIDPALALDKKATKYNHVFDDRRVDLYGRLRQR
ncbi:MAG: acyltransferase [Firmicutes bacterium]|nr:acyltransferase [Bacillota bacterium]